MATLDPNEIMFTPFEPKTKNRFIMYIEGVPAYMIKAAKRPSIQFEEIDVSKQPEMWKEVEKLSGGDRITPVLVNSDGKVEIGFRGIGCNYNT